MCRFDPGLLRGIEAAVNEARLPESEPQLTERAKFLLERARLCESSYGGERVFGEDYGKDEL